MNELSTVKAKDIDGPEGMMTVYMFDNQNTQIGGKLHVGLFPSGGLFTSSNGDVPSTLRTLTVADRRMLGYLLLQGLPALEPVVGDRVATMTGQVGLVKMEGTGGYMPMVFVEWSNGAGQWVFKSDLFEAPPNP